MRGSIAFCAVAVAAAAFVGCCPGAQKRAAHVRAVPPASALGESQEAPKVPSLDVCEETDKRSPADKLLDAAIEKDDLEGVRKALAQGATLDDGRALLVADGRPAIVRFLKSKGAKEPTLIDAIDAGALATVERLLASGVKPREDESGNDPLTEAARDADLEPDVRRKMVTLLLARGANARTSDAFNRAIDCVEEGAGGKSNVDRCDLELVKILLRNGAVVDRTTLFYAFRYPDSIRTQWLDVLFATRIAPKDVADALVGAESPQRLALVTRVTKKIGPQNLPFDEAARQLDVDLLRAMFDAGARAEGARGDEALADVLGELKNRRSSTSIDQVNTVVGLLLAHGAVPNRRVGELPLEIAKSHGDAKTIELLMKAGAREPAATKSMATPALPPRPPSRDEFPDPWRPRWDPGSHM